MMSGFKFEKWCHAMLLACMALAPGCSGGPSGPYSVITGFPAEKAPESVPEHRLDDNIGVYDISMVGDYVLVAEKRTGHFYTLYDRELNRICGFANKGRGPGEYLAPAYYGEYEITAGGDPVLSVYDRALFRYDRIRIDCHEGKAHIVSSTALPSDSPLEIRFLRKCADGYAGVLDVEDCRFFTSDGEFTGVTCHDPVFPFPDKMSAHETAQTVSCMDPGCGRVASAYYNFPQIDIRSVDGSLVKSVFIREIVKPEDVSPDTASDCFLKIESAGDFIYALYEDPSQPGYSSILVFDWDGNPAERYRIGRAVSFTVDTAGKRILALNENQDVSICSVYAL